MAIEDVIAALELSLRDAPTVAEEEAAVMSGVPIARYVAGLTSADELRGELSALGYKGLKQSRYIQAAQLKRQLELFQDRLTLWRGMLKNGELTIGDMTTLLEQAGMAAENIAYELDRSASQKPAVAVKRVMVTLGIISAQEVPPLPKEQAVSVALGVLEAVVVSEERAGVSPVQIMLSLTEAEGIPPVVPPQPVALSLEILEVMEV